MQSVQGALIVTGIPAYVGAWRPSAAGEQVPDKYIVYTTRRWEGQHADDELVNYNVYVYMDMYTKDDPTTDELAVRAAMRAANFAMYDEEETYDKDSGAYRVSWTWRCEQSRESGYAGG